MGVPALLYILDGDRVFFIKRPQIRFAYDMQQVSKLLKGKSKDDTLAALHTGLRPKPWGLWKIFDDIPNPYGDRRWEKHSTVFTYDLNADKLYFTHQQESIQIPLSRFRETGPAIEAVKMAEFTPIELNTPRSLDLDDFPSPCHTYPPFSEAPERTLAFVRRLLKDFALQWRHVFCRTYRDITFLKLARAVLAIAILDIRMVEKEPAASLSKRRNFYNYTHHAVSNLVLPDWKPMCKKAVLGGVEVRLNQDLKEAFDELSREVASGRERKGKVRKGARFLLLSVRYFMLCWINSATGELEFAPPQRLIDGVEPPTPQAVSLFLQAFTPAYFPCGYRSPLHSLPMEIQDQIIIHMAENPIEAARLACVIGIGSPFHWMRWGAGGKREPIWSYTQVVPRGITGRIESRVAFDGGMGVWKRLGEGEREGRCRRGDGMIGAMDEDDEVIMLFAGVVYK